MEEVYTNVLEQLARLQAAVGRGFSEAISSADADATTASSTSSSSDIVGRDKKGTSTNTTSHVVWWLSSLLFGVSSTFVYHWIREEIRQSKKNVANDSSNNTFQRLLAIQAERIVIWGKRQVRQIENAMSGRSPSEITLQLSLGTSLFLPDSLTVPWVVGCFMVSKSLWYYGSSDDTRPLVMATEKYPPYLFLCFCPGKHRFQLWFTWMGLQMINIRGYSRSFPAREKRIARDKSMARTLQEAHSSISNTVEVKEASKVKQNSSRYLEVLVHNVSHTDIILSLDAPTSHTDSTNSVSDSPYCLCRPRFSYMDTYCRLILESLSGNTEEIVEFPRYERSEDDPRYQIKDKPTGVPTPVGFGLRPDPSLMADMAQVRVRGRDLAKFDTEGELSPWPASPGEKAAMKLPINYVFLPILATLLPCWHAQIQERKYPRNVKRVLILVTGVGTPRNWTHSVSGNSTEACAQLMETFLKRVDPDLTVVKIHSQTNIFRYDENLRFVDKEFTPVMNAWRDAHARGLPYPDEPGYSVTSENPFDADWRNSMSVTLSAADGSTARTHAIRESLRPFRPTFFHFWQLKTFWHETKIVNDDIEIHSYETMETTPAVDVEKLRDEHIQMLVDEMKAFRGEMIDTLRRGKNDISTFWLRKSRKPVLAVLLVQSHGMSRPVIYRGTNMEVSMPTGSLCAERNVIGSALAANPELKREDLKSIAVLAIPTLEEMVAEKTIRRVDSSASVGSTTLDSNPDVSMDRRMSIGSEVDDWILPSDQQQQQQQQLQLPQGMDQSFTMVLPNSDENQAAPQLAESESTPVRKIRLFSKSAGRQKHKRSVVIQSSRDLNPLRPCGKSSRGQNHPM
uniref:Uncharacterized protein n=1 Tax=Amphora coffeiformis TaxID=265554 RepID=A0A7S3L099_9STRA|eukprot:scaffold31414_cov183-Amphora_coffeaeformis.AAC.8